MSSMLAWAKWYVSIGCAVFPLPPLRKKTGHLGITSGTTDLAQIEAWWSAQPDSNIGVLGNPAATENFLLRVDIDPKNGGDTAWRGLVYEHGSPDTLAVKTPSGGFHYYFHTQRPYGNGTGTLPTGIDIRGHSSGYTVGAPSVTVFLKGESVAGRYELIEHRPIAEAPQWLLDAIATVERSEPIETVSQISDEAYAELRDALLSEGMLNDWDRWSDNGLALRTLGDRGYRLWSEYSTKQLERHPGADVTDNADTWWGRHSTTGIKSDYRSIFARAQALGWQNPKTFDPATLGFGQAPLPAGASAEPIVATLPLLGLQQPARKKFQLLSENEFVHGPAPEWRIHGLVPDQGLGMVYGPSGVSKSFFTLDMLMCIADGRNYGAKGLEVKQGRVVYVMAEGAGGMRQRVRAYRQKYPAQHDNFKIIAAEPNLMTPEDVGAISQAVMEAGGADVIVFDTMVNCMAGADENSAKDITILFSNARAIATCLKAHVMFVHHSGKDEGKGARGSSSIRGHLEMQIVIGQNPSDPSRRVARVDKMRDGEDNFTWEYTLEPVISLDPNNPFSSAVVKHSDRTFDSKSAPRRRTGTGNIITSTMMSIQDQYEGGVPMEVLIAAVALERSDMRPDSIKRTLTKCIDSGELSIDSESNIRLAWLQ